MASQPDTPIFTFGPFQLDPSERRLTREGMPVALTPKSFDLLVYLVERHGRLVEKTALMTALWPDTIVEEANLAYNISTLRKALADGREDAKFIETVPTRGYRFVAPVLETRPDAPRPEARPRRWQWAAVAVVGITAAAVAALWTTGRIRRSNDGVATPAVFTQLTATPTEIPVFSQAISPDGKYLAYSDRTAMHVQVIATGETQTLPNSWGRLLILGWNDAATEIRAVQTDTPVQTIWDVSLVGSARRRSGLVWPGEAVSLAPDGSNFLTIRQDSELRVEPVHGIAHSVLRFAKDDFIRAPVWTPDAKRVFFLRGDPPTALETFAVQRGGASVVFTAPAGQVIQTIGPPGRDGRLLAFMGLRGRPGLISVWQVPVNVDTGTLAGEPKRLTDWREWDCNYSLDWGCHQISRTADGRSVALPRRMRQRDVYVAAFDARTARLGVPRRLTMNERNDYPTAWTPDNRSIIFSSSRNGRQGDIYKQDIDSSEAQLLVSGDDDKNFARVTGDGRWMLFIQSAFLSDISRGPTRVMRAAIEGGIAEEVYASPGSAWPQCSLLGGCIVCDQRGDKTVISALDPIRGKGAELATIPISWNGYILPDGTEFAYLVAQDRPRNHIRIISFVGKPALHIVVHGANDLENLDPLPDGSGWFSVNHTSHGTELLYITRDGKSRVLWVPDRTAVDSAMSSRDGKHLAIHTFTTSSNAWMMTGF